MRLVSVAVMGLICWGQAASLRAAEAVRLPVSCRIVANKVVVVPSMSEELHIIVGGREHKIIRACAPGVLARCKSWEVQRFSLLCGGRPVRWRVIAGQLLNRALMPARKETLFRHHLEPWEVRTLLSEGDFAPVDEFGGRILSIADKSMSRLRTGGESGAKVAVETEITAAPSGSPRPQAGPTSSPETGSLNADAPPSPQQSPGATARHPDGPLLHGVPDAVAEPAQAATAALPADKVVVKLANVVTVSRFDGPKREAGPASAGGFMTAQFAVPMPRRPGGKPAARPRRSLADLLLIASASAFLLVIGCMTIFTAIMWWKSAAASGSPYRGMVHVVYEDATYQEDSDPEALAETCRDLMKQVAAELVNAMSAVNSLKGAAALQTALHGELESIRRSLGFTPQVRGTSGERKDWKQIKMQLLLNLEGARRIVGIAEAARASFSAHPAALEVITTRLEAYAFLGVNANSSEMVLKKAVNALRQCWHPDLATDEEDRRLREIRIKQINVAWDLISRKQVSAC